MSARHHAGDLLHAIFEAQVERRDVGRSLREGEVVVNLDVDLRAFRLGAGGPLGPGTQYQSWISIDDMLGAIVHAIHTAAIAGPMNATAPEPVPQREFARTLGRVLHRPALVPAPAFALRLMLGEMADPLLLASARVLPERLTQTGFAFRHPALEGCLRHVLGQQ